ncbi:MAG: PD40 domain-containing protein [Myxococcales bacterium]|nr:PD40 domain-containing protein [Myxococcales bacterium]
MQLITTHFVALAALAVVACAPVSETGQQADNLIGVTTITTLASRSGNFADGDARRPALSDNRRFVAFDTGASLAAGDVNFRRDVYLFDRNTQTVQRISVAAPGGRDDGDSTNATVSSDGRFVAFESTADLTGELTTVTPPRPVGQVYRFDRVTGQTRLVSRGTIQLPNGTAAEPSISADGSRVAFSSTSSNISSEDTNTRSDIYVFVASIGGCLLMSKTTTTTTTAGVVGNGESFEPSLSADGRVVAFTSTSTNFHGADFNNATDVFVYDSIAARNTLASRSGTLLRRTANGASREPSISPNGLQVAFTSDGSDMVSGDTNLVSDVFVTTVASGSVERVSRPTGANTQFTTESSSPSMDDDFIAFENDGAIRVHDLFYGFTVTSTTLSDGNSPALRAIGRSGPFLEFDVAFATSARLDPIDTNNGSDVYVASQRSL